MDEDLQDALTDIRGIGPATAAEIEAVLDEHAEDQTGQDEANRDRDVDVDLEAAGEALRSAWDYHQAGQHSYAARFVEEVAIALEVDLDP